MNIKKTLAALLLTTTLAACGGSDEAKSADEVEDLILYAQWGISRIFGQRCN